MTAELTQERIELLLDDLHDVRDWFTRAPIAELEAVEDAIGENSPMHKIDEAISLMFLIHGRKSK